MESFKIIEKSLYAAYHRDGEDIFMDVMLHLYSVIDSTTQPLVDQLTWLKTVVERKCWALGYKYDRRSLYGLTRCGLDTVTRAKDVDSDASKTQSNRISLEQRILLAIPRKRTTDC